MSGVGSVVVSSGVVMKPVGMPHGGAHRLVQRQLAAAAAVSGRLRLLDV